MGISSQLPQPPLTRTKLDAALPSVPKAKAAPKTSWFTRVGLAALTCMGAALAAHKGITSNSGFNLTLNLARNMQNPSYVPDFVKYAGCSV